jgi:uncharacterized damage-inducible protein DinB
MMKSPIDGLIRLMAYQKTLTEKSIEQIDLKFVHKTIPGFDHSIAVLMKHIGGNLKSLWTNFRTEDGEKPWRDRESEFIDDFKSREELMNHWQEGWDTFFEAAKSINEDETENIVYIRNEGHTVREAAERTLSHISYHTGQIVMMARYFAGESWTALSIPKGKTEEYNRNKFESEKSVGFYKDRI